MHVSSFNLELLKLPRALNQNKGQLCVCVWERWSGTTVKAH